MPVAGLSQPRVSVDGKFFRTGASRFFVKGVAYGPFTPQAGTGFFAPPAQTAADFAQLRSLGANVVRVYHVPEKWFLDLASQHELRVMVDIPWNKNLGFLDSKEWRDLARKAIREGVLACGGHPAVFCFSVGNEIPPDVVRWSGAKAVEDFIDELVLEAKHADPECLCTFSNFPPTEFLRPQMIDFACFNVYLHQEPAFKNYLARLQMLAETKPLVLGELGIDSLREGEPRKCEMLSWQIEDAFRSGLAGAVVFSFTDDWWRDGRIVEGWQMGLTTAGRHPKNSFTAVQTAFRLAPKFPLPRLPKVSIVVASFNAERTLGLCLDSLERLNYPDYEIVVVDDGSRDATPQIAGSRQRVRYIRHDKNLGLSAARNTGIGAASGEIVAFTDADCRADEDWLYYLVADLLSHDFAAIGGPNLLPPEDSAVAAAVMVSPGGPAHVMLTDRQAEHIPGCNMAFFRWVLKEVGGFDPIFRLAGDDVDLCWRLQQAGYKIGFSPSAFVWHYRRSTATDYLKQQRGYGEAEALLVRKHPEYFNSIGGSIWRGRIYTPSRFGVLLRGPVIYRGLFGSAGFQALYASEPSPSLMLCTTLEYHVLVTLPLWVLSVSFHPLFPLALTSLLISLGVCVLAGAQAQVSRAKCLRWTRPLVALLFFLQPIVRGWARYQGRLTLRPGPLATQQTLDSVALRDSRLSLEEVDYWGDEKTERFAFVAGILGGLEHNGWPHRPDIGWSDHDVEVYGSRWCNLQITTLTEDHAPKWRLVRCRLRSRWSLPAKVALSVMAGVELLVLGFVRTRYPWFWLVLLTIPAFIWFLRREQRSLQSVLVVFLDGLAKNWKLTKVRPGSSEQGKPQERGQVSPIPNLQRETPSSGGGQSSEELKTGSTQAPV